MKGFIAGASLAYVAGAALTLTATIRSPHTEDPKSPLHMVGGVLVLGALWPWQAYVAVQEWQP